MDVRQLIVSSLSILVAAGLACGEEASGDEGNWDTGACPGNSNFDIESPVTLQNVESVLTQLAETDPAAVPCQQYCEVVLWGSLVSLTTCNHQFEPGFLDAWNDPNTGETGSAPPFLEGDTVLTVSCTGVHVPACLGGRRPLGHVEHLAANPTDASSPQEVLSHTLANFAQLEAASVTAFDQLARQLSGWGAPCELIERCRTALRDEVDHAAVLRALAETGGAEVPTPRHCQVAETLLSVALHNATEGCVSETWSALLAHRWAKEATDPALREVFAKIAEDETRHAQLAWDLHVWFMSQLDDAQATEVEAARLDALARLPAVAAQQALQLPGALGSPPPQQARALAQDFAMRLAA